MEGTEGSGAKRILTIIVVLVIVAVGGYLLYQTGGNGTATGGGESEPVPAVVSPELELTPAEKRGDVAKKKAEILALVSSGRPLTPEQKAEIGGIMLTKAHLYQFTEPERVKIFDALQR